MAKKSKEIFKRHQNIIKDNAKPWYEYWSFGVGTLIIKPSSDTKNPPGSPKMRKTTFFALGPHWLLLH